MRCDRYPRVTSLTRVDQKGNTHVANEEALKSIEVLPLVDTTQEGHQDKQEEAYSYDDVIGNAVILKIHCVYDVQKQPYEEKQACPESGPVLKGASVHVKEGLEFVDPQKPFPAVGERVDVSDAQERHGKWNQEHCEQYSNTEERKMLRKLKIADITIHSPPHQGLRGGGILNIIHL